MKSARYAICPPDLVIRRAVQAIQQGSVVAIPTETYYGLAADPANELALQTLFTLKQRPKDKPILLLISRIEHLSLYVKAIPQQYQHFIDRYWPGPLTLVFPAKPEVSSLLTGGTGTIGIRLTPHPIACRIIDLLGAPITATSANLSAHEPARNVRDVQLYFPDSLGFVVDGGPSDGDAASTVLTLVRGQLCIARPGRITLPGLPHIEDIK